MPGLGPLLASGRDADVFAYGRDLVVRRSRRGMERIDGSTMLDELSRRPWTLRRNAARLATLHQRLHEISAPDWLDRFSGGGDCVVHLDLHPLNVILSRRGPVLIDWTNAAGGGGPADVALTWLVMTAAELPDAGMRRLAASVAGES